MKNHEIVPVQLINAIAGLKKGGGYKHIRELLKHKLVHHDNSKYDGYRLTPLGYDFLAIKAFTMRNRISGVGKSTRSCKRCTREVSTSPRRLI